MILAAPAWNLAPLVESFEPALAGLLSGIPYSSSAIVGLVYRDAEYDGQRMGFGFLVPKKERARLAAVTFVGTKFANRTPEGLTLLRCFFGGISDEGVLNESDESLLRHRPGRTAEDSWAEGCAGCYYDCPMASGDGAVHGGSWGAVERNRISCRRFAGVVFGGECLHGDRHSGLHSHGSGGGGEDRARLTMWRTHSCVPCRDFLDTSAGANTRAGVEMSLDAARTSAYATSQLFDKDTHAGGLDLDSLHRITQLEGLSDLGVRVQRLEEILNQEIQRPAAYGAHWTGPRELDNTVARPPPDVMRIQIFKGRSPSISLDISQPVSLPCPLRIFRKSTSADAFASPEPSSITGSAQPLRNGLRHLYPSPRIQLRWGQRDHSAGLQLAVCNLIEFLLRAEVKRIGGKQRGIAGEE